MTELWTSVKIGDSVLNNRLVMAPMTRSRALDSGEPGPLAAEYYAQRATMGLMITDMQQQWPLKRGLMVSKSMVLMGISFINS
ncbi:oxidoreductase [Weissella thailandensis]|uniref:oxidoreductase n=1 Tax=Weissella thailandensis TaxID=89061 RepID=UPI00118F5A8B|nr:hypothetical protein [Weissella thailandensis]GEP74495.1 hypothetical protein WTH01_07420 [Weissella thailandensis]